MEIEVLFWAAMLCLNVFLMARIIRRMRSRVYMDKILSEAFERHRRRQRTLQPIEPSYARERYSRDDWAA